MASPEKKAYQLPVLYRLFFLLIEPALALVGAYYAHFRQEDYLTLTHAESATLPVPVGTSIVLSQLANLYFLFTLNEAIVLRSTGDLRVWKALLFGLLVADFGHLYSLRSLGPSIYWDVVRWNPIDWGNVPVVYLGASMRIAFIAGVGLGGRAGSLKKKQ